jgi:hypothetical protein
LANIEITSLTNTNKEDMDFLIQKESFMPNAPMQKQNIKGKATTDHSMEHLIANVCQTTLTFTCISFYLSVLGKVSDND